MGNLPGVYIFWLIVIFWFGACAGSFINVIVARLPLEKSVIWPGSRCGSCYQRIPLFFSNIPIFSYIILRGKCGTCGARYSSRYLWVELLSGLGFAALFYFDVIRNVHHLGFVQEAQYSLPYRAIPPLSLCMLFLRDAVLLFFLIPAALCDFDGKIIPLPLTVTGTIVGLIFAALCPWPWPNLTRPEAVFIGDDPWSLSKYAGKIPEGIYSWPFWGPLPSALHAGTWQMGLLTGLVGAAAGNIMMRLVKFLFEKGLGKEALGMGDADLMMMAGAFLGWQMIVASFFAGTFVALIFAIPLLIFRRENMLAFGPGLAIGIVITMMSWHRIEAGLQLYFFDWLTMLLAGTILGGGMFLCSLVLRPRV